MKLIEETKESFGLAVSAIRVNRTRGVLTVLGIIIGIVAVATTMTVSNGLGNKLKESLSSMGTDVFYVSRMPWVFTGNFFEMRNRPQLTYKVSEKLERSLMSTKIINPTTGNSMNIKYRSNVLEDIPISGTTEKQIMMAAAVPEYGRFLTAADVRYRKFVCVIGSEIRDRFFKNTDPLQKTINIGRHRFRVVGVMEKQGSAGFFGGPNFDLQIVVPITSYFKAFGGQRRSIAIAVKAPNPETMEDFRYELVGEMRKIRKLKPIDKDDFSINTMNTLLDAFNRIMRIILIIGMVITSISLFVGGIGVMNIMFVTVTERTREIGIRKAIGAKRRSILSQFLFESAGICLVGGLIGVILSFGVAALVNKFVLPASVSPPIVAIALLVSVLVGILSGMIPALRASKLDPIVALRYE